MAVVAKPIEERDERELWNSYADNYENYGNLSLGLGPQWRRKPVGLSAIEQAWIGHENGKADIFDTNDPRRRLDFKWVDMRSNLDLDRARAMGYEPVTRSRFVKNPDLWSWTAEGRIRRGSNEEAWYRTEERWLRSKEEREERKKYFNPKKEADSRLAGAAQSAETIALSPDGMQLQQTTRPRVS